MGLEDAIDESGASKGNSSREYVEITTEEIVNFFSNRPENWSQVEDKHTKELVFKHVPNSYNEFDIELRCYTTIDKRTGVSRDKGADAIRLVVWYPKEDRPVWGKKKTLRIKTWRKNLSGKISSVLGDVGETVTACSDCGHLMVVRDGKYGKFLGCSSYPNCNNTVQPDNL